MVPLTRSQGHETLHPLEGLTGLGYPWTLDLRILVRCALVVVGLRLEEGLHLTAHHSFKRWPGRRRASGAFFGARSQQRKCPAGGDISGRSQWSGVQSPLVTVADVASPTVFQPPAAKCYGRGCAARLDARRHHPTDALRLQPPSHQAYSPPQQFH